MSSNKKKENKFNFGSQFIMGGLTELNDENINIRKLQIKNGIKLHTCNDYGNSLEVIKFASAGIEDNTKIISKIYYKYPDLSNRRFRTLIDQIHEQNKRLDFIPTEWDIQLCCYIPHKELISKEAKLFFEYIYIKFGIKNIYLEFYPIYKYKVKNISYLNKIYKGQTIFGLLGYNNILNGVFNEDIIKDISIKSIPLIYVGILGFGNQNKIFFEGIKKNKIININLLYFLKNYLTNEKISGITHVSSMEHYEKLKKSYLNLTENKGKIDFSLLNNFKVDKDYYSFQYDHYGSYFSLIYLVKNPKVIFHILKYKIFSKKKSRNFNHNFFGI